LAVAAWEVLAKKDPMTTTISKTVKNIFIFLVFLPPFELLQRAHSPQVLPDGSASRAAGNFN
jgi:hypothetical protein